MNIIIDRVSLETNDIIITNIKFMNRMNDYATVVDNKYYIKNSYYQLIGSSFAVIIRNYYIDIDILLQADIPKDLIIIKDFTSNKKIKIFFSYKILN